MDQLGLGHHMIDASSSIWPESIPMRYLPGVLQNVSHIEGPQPSSVTAPST